MPFGKTIIFRKKLPGIVNNRTNNQAVTTKLSLTNKLNPISIVIEHSRSNLH